MAKKQPVLSEDSRSAQQRATDGLKKMSPVSLKVRTLNGKMNDYQFALMSVRNNPGFVFSIKSELLNDIYFIQDLLSTLESMNLSENVKSRINSFLFEYVYLYGATENLVSRR